MSIHYLQLIDSNHHRPSWLIKTICLLTVIGMMDAHIAIMQTWAWVSMLHDRIPEQGIEQAIDTTFSGQYPCDQCRIIAEMKAEEQEQKSQFPLAPLTEVEAVAKIIAYLPSERSSKFSSPVCLRIPFVTVRSLLPDEPTLSVPSPPPRTV